MGVSFSSGRFQKIVFHQIPFDPLHEPGRAGQRPFGQFGGGTNIQVLPASPEE